MPTKPTTTFVLATNANYTVGPFAGSPTKVVPTDALNGFVPGQGIPAAHHNYLWHHTGEWLTDWLLLGTYDPDLDAHLVETDATGLASLGALALGGTAAAIVPLVVDSNSGAASSASSFTHSAGGVAVSATAASTLGTVRAIAAGTGPALQGIAAGIDNVGVVATGAGAGSGGDFTGGATGDGIVATGGASNGDGAVLTGTGSGYGVRAVGGPTGPPVWTAPQGAAPQTASSGTRSPARRPAPRSRGSRRPAPRRVCTATRRPARATE